MCEPTLFDAPDPPTRTVDRTSTSYVTSVEMTLEELEALACGDVTADLRAFANEWLVSVTGTSEAWLAMRHAKGKR